MDRALISMNAKYQQKAVRIMQIRTVPICKDLMNVDVVKDFP